MSISNPIFVKKLFVNHIILITFVFLMYIIRHLILTWQLIHFEMGFFYKNLYPFVCLNIAVYHHLCESGYKVTTDP